MSLKKKPLPRRPSKREQKKLNAELRLRAELSWIAALPQWLGHLGMLPKSEALEVAKLIVMAAAAKHGVNAQNVLGPELENALGWIRDHHEDGELLICCLMTLRERARMQRLLPDKMLEAIWTYLMDELARRALRYEAVVAQFHRLPWPINHGKKENGKKEKR